MWPGLKNQGTTCYVNSVLQLLFSIPNFRSAILRYNVPQEKSFMDDGNTEDNGQGANTIVKRNNNRDVFFQTQRTFQHLNDGTRRAFVDPVGLVRAFVDRNPTFNRNRHECAHEFLLLILQQLETYFEAAPAESFTNQLAHCIGGVIETVKTCTVCQFHTTIDNNHLKLFKSMSARQNRRNHATPLRDAYMSSRSQKRCNWNAVIARDTRRPH